MKRVELSNQLTFAYRFILFPLWCVVALGMIVITALEASDPNEIGVAFCFILFMILLTLFWMRKLRQVSYDEQNVYIKNFRKELTYDLRKIRNVSGGSWFSFDPFFEIELEQADGTLLKIDFLPPFIEHLDYSFGSGFKGEVLTFIQTAKARINKN